MLCESTRTPRPRQTARKLDWSLFGEKSSAFNPLRPLSRNRVSHLREAERLESENEQLRQRIESLESVCHTLKRTEQERTRELQDLIGECEMLESDCSDLENDLRIYETKPLSWLLM